MTQHDTNPGKPRQCEVCGRHLPPDAPGGNCPTCLWALLADDGEDSAGEEVLQRFGSYELLEELARGGMGVVWKARQHGLRRYVALKTILEGHLASSEQVLRFYTEARAAASLDHPGIVPIYEIGEDEGRHFYSMMLMEGGSLADVMRSNIRLAPREAARLVVTVARALHFAHQRGVLHRDVKPSNILLDLEGRPRLADFGLARIADAESSVTRSLTALGTPAYMAPEQTSGKSSEVTTAADIHGLGVVLYELLTGSLPFLGATPLETVKQLLETEAPPPRTRVPEVERDLEVICLRCLQKRPERRYASAADLADDLERWLSGEPISARPVSAFERLMAWVRRKPELASVLGLLGVVLVGAFVTTLFLLFQVQRESDARSVALRAEESQRLAFQSLATIDENPGQALMLAMEATARGSTLSARNALLASLEVCRESRRFLGHEKVVRKVEFSPDGARLATASQDGTARIWSVGREEPPLILAGHGAWVRSASFSPDGSKIVTAGDDHTARVWDAGNGRELLKIVGLTGKVRDAQFTPDGQHVFVICSGGAILANASSGEVQQIFDPGEDILTCATLSPDGSRVVTGRGDGEARVWHVVRGSLLATLPRHTDRVFSVAFSGDGKTLVTASEPEAYVWDAESFEQISVLRGHSYGIYDLALTRDGKILATGSEDFTARIWEAHTGKLLHTLQHGHKVIRVQLSRDETLLLTASYDTTARIWNLSTGAPVAEFRGHAAPLLWAAFSPVGRTAATACVDYTARLWNVGLRDPLVLGNRFGPKLTNADRAPGGHLLLALPARSNTPLLLDGATLKVVRSLTGHEGPVEVGSFSPDGTLVASGAADSTARIWDVATGKSLCVLEGHEGPLIAAVFSLDQRHVGTAALTGPARVWSVPEGSLEATCTPKNPIGQIRFSPSSTALLVADTGGWLRILNIASGQAPVFDVEDPIACAVFDRGETELATVVGTTRVQIRDARKRQVTGALVHLARVSYMAASSDHRWIATLALDATARVWDFPARKCVLEIRRRQMIPQRARFAADGTSLVVSWIVEGERDSGLSETVFYPLDVETSARAAYFGELTPDERDHFQVGSETQRLEQRKAWRGGHIFGVDG